MAKADATEAEEVADAETSWPVTTVSEHLGSSPPSSLRRFFNQEPWYVLGFVGVAGTQLYRAIALRVGLPLGRFA